MSVYPSERVLNALETRCRSGAPLNALTVDATEEAPERSPSDREAPGC